MELAKSECGEDDLPAKRKAKVRAKSTWVFIVDVFDCLDRCKLDFGIGELRGGIYRLKSGLIFRFIFIFIFIILLFLFLCVDHCGSKLPSESR